MSPRLHPFTLAATLVLLASSARASERPGPPAGWLLGGTAPNLYSVAVVDPGPCGGGRSAVLRARDASDASYGTLMQLFDAADYRGKRIRLSGIVKTQDVRGWAGLWLRVDGPAPEKPLAFDNMQSRALLGTTACQRYDVVLDVAPQATRIGMGLLLSGTGDAWVQDLQLQVVDEKVATTDILGTWPTVATSPRNLAFDAVPFKVPTSPDEPTGRVGGVWFNDATVAWILNRKPDGSFEARGGDLSVKADGNRVHAKSGSFEGDLTIERKDGKTLITGTWGGWVKYPVAIEYDARSVHMKWGFYGRDLQREDGPQTPPGCADYTKADAAFTYDRLQLCGDVVSENPPPAQTVIGFLWSGFRRQPQYAPSLAHPTGGYTIRQKAPVVTSPQDTVK